MRQQLLSILLFLTLAFSASFFLKAGGAFSHVSAHASPVQNFVPERLRSFLAGYLWARADSMMHMGPIKDTYQNYQAGSYAGNTDILPLLHLIIAIMPEEPAPYQLLARNLALHLRLPEKAMRILQLGIMNNRDSFFLHELYASAAHVRIFTTDSQGKRRMGSALKYISRAIRELEKNPDSVSSDPAFTVSGYSIFKARILVELGRTADAFKAWSQSGLDLDKETDRLALIMRDYRDTGKEVKASVFPAFSGDESESQLSPADKTANDRKNLPLVPVLKLLVGAGLFLFVVRSGFPELRA